MIFWELFVSYLKIGFFGFGGGYAMLSLIQNEVVVQHAWMTNAECKAAAYGTVFWARSLRLSRSACRR